MNIAYCYRCKKSWNPRIKNPRACYHCNTRLWYLPDKERDEYRSSLMKGKNNHMWKGDDVGYAALHEWIKRRLTKPKFCEICNKNKPLDLANISQKYKRDLSDWEWLCRKCHVVQDGRIIYLRRSMLGKHHSKETKEKMSRDRKGQNTWSKGRRLSLETRRKMSVARMGRICSSETREKIRLSKLGDNNPNSKMNRLKRQLIKESGR